MQNVYIVYNVPIKAPGFYLRLIPGSETIELTLQYLAVSIGRRLIRAGRSGTAAGVYVRHAHALLLWSYNIRRHLRGDVRRAGQGGPDIG